MKSLKLLNLWVIPAFLAWWGSMHNGHLATNTLACPDFACIDSVNVRLDDDCKLFLQPQMVVASDIDPACLVNLQVEVFNPQGQSIGNTILADYAGQFLTYKLINTLTGNICWGHVRVEDKTPPALVCPEDTEWVVNTAYANILTGAIEDTDFSFRRNAFTCWLSAQTPEQGDYYYDTLSFQVAKDGIYTFVLLHDFVQSDIATAAIFQGDFFEETPCQNIIAFTENRDVITNGYVLGDFWNTLPFVQQQIPWLTPNIPPYMRLELELKQSQTYHLVTTSLKPEDTGNYAWIVLRDEITQQPNTEILKGKTTYQLPWISRLVCDDFERLKLPVNACYKTDSKGNIISINNDLRKILQLTGFPHKGSPWFTRGASVLDNCGDITICVGDQLPQSYGDCDSVVIKRTFAATDEKGNGALCSQNIIIHKPSIKDVVLPGFAAYIECDEEFPVDSTGYAHPSVTGYPLIRTAFGIKDLYGKFCTLGTTYTNKARVDICDNAYTFLREWVIYDWCNPGSTLIYNQLIKVGDFTPPEVVCVADDEGCPPIFSTGPFACTASFLIPELDTIFDNCSGWTVSVDVMVVKRTPLYDQDGEIEDYEYEERVFASGKKPGDLISNIPVGTHYFRYRVVDDCRNVRIQDCVFEVLDRSEPIAICKDFLNVSIGTNAQVSKLFAVDVDAGSFDNCSNIKIQIRRIVKEECIDEYEYVVDSYGDGTEGDGGGDNPIEEPPLGGGDGDGGGDNPIDEPPIGGGQDTMDNPGPRPGGEEDPLDGGDEEEDDGIYRSEWADFVYLTCCDIGDTIRVEIRVWDDADGNGIPGESENVDFCGRLIEDNYNRCWLDVLLEDKAKPACKPPLDLTLTCTDNRIRYESAFTCADSTLLDTLFGEFIATDNCEANMICREVIDTRNNCGVGTITRVYYAEDAVGNRSEDCRQVITITKAHNYEIKFPADIAGECKVVKDTVIDVQNLACDLLAVSVFDERFSTGSEECFKIQRTFRIINWCEYDGISAPVIISRDEDCDGIPGEEDVYVLRRPGAGNAMPAFIDRNNDETDQIPTAGTRGTTCNGNTNPKGYWRKSNSVGYWQYTQVLKVYDNEPPILIPSVSSALCANTDSCSTEISIPFIAEDDCSFEDIRFEVVIDYYNDSVDNINVLGPRIRGQYPKYRYDNNFPIGEHIVEIRVRDGCGNYSATRIPVKVEDCKAPTPVCINGLAAELMPVRPAQDVDGDSMPDKGAAIIWATDFITSQAIEDCSGPVTYSISRVGAVADRNQKSLMLTCKDAGNTLPVVIYAWDNANNPRSVQPDGTRGGANYGSCITYVQVQDNMLSCENTDSSRLFVTGRVTTESGMPLSGVPVELENGLSQQTQTNVQGMYGVSADVVTGNRLVTITPDFDYNHKEDVTTFDIILITKHILGTQLLSSPYKMIAADINNSQTITSLDVIQLRKLILGVEVTFPKNKSWRYIDKSFQFPQPNNPWFTHFPETIQVNADTSRYKTDADFIGVKIGDVSSSTQTIRNLPTAAFVIETENQVIEPFKTYEVSFTADLTQMDGYQFTLQFNPKTLELTDICYGVAKEENFGWRWLDQGQIVTSWNNPSPGQIAGQQKLFTLTFQSKTAGQLRDYLSIATRPAASESYNAAGEIKEVQLSFLSHLTLRTLFTLYQNKPNPFSDETIIGFNMSEAATARLQIYSTEGRLIKNITAFYNAGYQEVRVSSPELRGAGVYYYILEVNGWKETRKMLLK